MFYDPARSAFEEVTRALNDRGLSHSQTLPDTFPLIRKLASPEEARRIRQALPPKAASRFLCQRRRIYLKLVLAEHRRLTAIRERALVSLPAEEVVLWTVRSYWLLAQLALGLAGPFVPAAFRTACAASERLAAMARPRPVEVILFPGNA